MTFLTLLILFVIFFKRLKIQNNRKQTQIFHILTSIKQKCEKFIKQNRTIKLRKHKFLLVLIENAKKLTKNMFIIVKI